MPSYEVLDTVALGRGGGVFLVIIMNVCYIMSFKCFKNYLYFSYLFMYATLWPREGMISNVIK